jgi:hypothetical protein
VRSTAMVDEWLDDIEMEQAIDPFGMVWLRNPAA